MVDLRVLCCWYTFYGSGQVCSVVYSWLVSFRVVSCHKNPLCSFLSSNSAKHCCLYGLRSFLFHNVHLRIIGKLFSSLQFSRSVVSDSCRPHGLQHARPPCPSPTPGVYSNSCPLSRWCHPTISSFAVPFSSYLQSFPGSGSSQMSQLFASGGQNIGASVSVSVLPMNIQDLFHLGWTDWIPLQSKGPSRVFSNTTVKNHQFFSAQLSL